MINIYLCEDSKPQLESWEKAVEDYLIVKKFNAQLICASQKPDILLEELDLHPKTMGLYFLDICLQAELNGLQLATEIRKRDPLGEIVFITSKSEMCFLTYEYQVRALDFIIKDTPADLPARIRQCMDATAEKEQQIAALSLEPFHIKINGEKIFLNTNDILYIETTKDTTHKITIYTITGFEIIYGTLKEIETALEKYKCFYRCNKSIIVNKVHVRKIKHKEKQLVLSNDTVIQISSRQLKNIEPKV